MKNLFVLFFITLCATTFYAQTPSVSADEEAIKKVIINEFDAFIQRDFKTWADSYVDSPTTTFMVTDANTAGSLFAVSDFKKISKGMKAMFDSGAKSTMNLANRDGWLIRIKGDMAYAVYNEEFLMDTGVKIKAKTQKVMEKVKGQWKIATTSSIADFNHAIVPTINPEEEAIKKVVESENAAFLAGDADKVRSFYNFQPYAWGTVSFTNGKSLHAEGEAFNKFYDVIKPQNNLTTEHKDYTFKINGNTAWQTNNMIQTNSTNDKKGYSHQLRCFEKINGVWKIVALSSHPYEP